MTLFRNSFKIIVIILKLISFGTCFGGFFSSIGDSIANTAISGVCSFKECCHVSSIPADFQILESNLKTKLYGQHFVQEVVLNALRAHWDGKPQKALTLSFHGWPGNGKNYVTQMVIDALYKYGEKSKFVHYYTGRIDFPRHDLDHIAEYKQKLYDNIQWNVQKCPKQLFVFDEVDKMAPTILDIIKPMIDYRRSIEGVDYRQAIFIFLSNTGGTQINQHYLKLWKEGGMKREDMRMVDFEKLIAMGAFNEEGGFYRSDNVKSNLIDFYVPFLPMERRHVRQCVMDQFKLRNVHHVKEEHIEEAMEAVSWGPENVELFSNTGCKAISQRVGATVAKYYWRNEL